MEGIYIAALKETGYRATRFHRMLGEYGGLETARRLINDSSPAEGYTKLYELNRLDLTVEALVVCNSTYHALFSDAEIQLARRRLEEYRFELPE